MSQAHSHVPQRRGWRNRNGRTGATTGLTTVPDLLSRRRPSPPPPPRRRRPALLTFALGLSLGYGLAGPLPELARNGAATLAGLLNGPRSLAAVLDPLGIGKRRVLVVGTDHVGENTDVMFTVQIGDGVTRITQVPRDTYVEQPGEPVMKANALLATSGIEAAKREVGQLVGEPVERYLRVDLDAVAKVANALGGVEVDVPKRMYYVDNAQGLYIDLYPGRQVLRGDELLGFLRFRHDEAGDLGRMERQRLVINQVFTRLAQPSTLTQLPALLKIAGEDINTDLTPIEMTQLLTAMARTNLSTTRLPGRLYWQDDLSYWMPDTNTAHPSGSGQEPTP